MNLFHNLILKQFSPISFENGLKSVKEFVIIGHDNLSVFYTS